MPPPYESENLGRATPMRKVVLRRVDGPASVGYQLRRPSEREAAV